MKIRTIFGLTALTALTAIGSVYALDQAARADVTPIIVPTKPTVPTMNIGATVEPTASGTVVAPPTALETPSVAPLVTATMFGGMLG